MTYPLARDGVFATVQGEGVMLGVPMVFVRLAGCSLGCPQCDTDYRVHLIPKAVRWIDSAMGGPLYAWSKT